MKRVFWANLPIDKVSLKIMPHVLVDLAKSKSANPFLVTYLNAYHFNLAQKNKKYQEVLRKTDLVYADGWGVVLAARLWGIKLPGRLTAYDFFDGFCRLCEQEKLSLFFLGGKKGVAKKTASFLSKKHPQLIIKGWHCGFFNNKEESKLIKKINRLQPDFLLVNMGAPKQEIWLDKNLPRLKIRVGWCVGGLFDYIGGDVVRVPSWFGHLGFEWFFRLFVEPRRLWRRYLIGLPIFWMHILRLRLKSLINS